MNRPPEEFVHVDEERLLNFSTACLKKPVSHTSMPHSSVVCLLILTYEGFVVTAPEPLTDIAEVLKTGVSIPIQISESSMKHRLLSCLMEMVHSATYRWYVPPNMRLPKQKR